jgi:hypothetical protein
VIAALLENPLAFVVVTLLMAAIAVLLVAWGCVMAGAGLHDPGAHDDAEDRE